MRAKTILGLILAMTFAAAAAVQAQRVTKSAAISATAPTAAASGSAPAAAPSAKKAQPAHVQEFSLAEGEKRFRQNCGRCHVAPDKFPPRMMATVLRHMRVRATITDRDARLILWYMTQ